MTATLMRRTWPGAMMRSRRVSETSKFCRSRLSVAVRELLPASPDTSPSGRFDATVTPGLVPLALSLDSSTSEEIATRLSGSMVRSETVSLSIAVSTLTSTMARPGPTRASSSRSMLALSVASRSVAPPGPLSGSSSPARTMPLRRVDHRHRLRRDAGDRRGDEVADRLGLAAVELAAGHGDGDRGRAGGGARERLADRVGEVDAGGADVRGAGDGAGELALLGAPVGGVEHLAGGAEAGQAVEDLVAGRAAGRQAPAGELHADAVAGGGLDEDGAVGDLEGHALGLERGDDLAGGGGVEAGVEQRHRRLRSRRGRGRRSRPARRGRPAPRSAGGGDRVRPRTS